MALMVSLKIESGLFGKAGVEIPKRRQKARWDKGFRGQGTQLLVHEGKSDWGRCKMAPCPKLICEEKDLWQSC